jgi:large repetitive protein
MRREVEMNPVICLALVLAALSPPPEITGTIVDYNGKPVAGVPISVVAVNSEDQVTKKTVSESNGSFSFTGLAPGGYGLVAKTGSACAISDAIEVDIGFTSIVHLRLAKRWCYGSALHFAEPPVNR